MLHNAPAMDTIEMGAGLGFMEDISAKLLASVGHDAPSPHEQRLTWNTPIARGHASSIVIRDGVEMRLTNVFNTVPWGFELVHQPCGLELGFSRQSAVRVSTMKGEVVGVAQGQFCVSQVKEPTRFVLESRGGSAECCVSLQFEPEGLVDALGIEDLPAAFRDVLDDTRPYTVSQYGMTTQMYQIVDGLTQCGLRGAMRRLYFESKALELVVLATEAATPRAVTSPTLTRGDIERLEHARSLLSAGFASPPSLRSLARACGLNERKLKEGFKQRFGTTVFAFVRSQRMRHAHEILSSSDRSVTEVAQQVGYANPSKFAAAFRREFGVSPSAVLAA